MTQPTETPVRSRQDSRRIFLGCVMILLGVLRLLELLPDLPALLQQNENLGPALVLPGLFIVFFIIGGAITLWQGYHRTSTAKQSE